jgi:hypothetical protein
MAAVPIYVWNGSAWQETGPTIPANPIKYQASAPSSPSTGDIWVDSDGDVTTGSQQFQRFRFVASGGETTISGADADGAILAYTAGLEQVILNGAVLVRGQDYTATDGTNITGLSPALVASDVLEVFSFIAFTVANTYTQSQVDGLVNAARAASGLVLLNTTTFSAVASASLPTSTFTSTYDNYRIIFQTTAQATSDYVYLRMRSSGSDDTGSNYAYAAYGWQGSGSQTNEGSTGTTSERMAYSSLNTGIRNIVLDVYLPNTTDRTTWNYQAIYEDSGSPNAILSQHGGGVMRTATQYDSLTFFKSGTFTGKITAYGYSK